MSNRTTVKKICNFLKKCFSFSDLCDIIGTVWRSVSILLCEKQRRRKLRRHFFVGRGFGNMKRGKVLFLVFGCTLLLLFAACGKDDDNSESSAASSAPVSTEDISSADTSSAEESQIDLEALHQQEVAALLDTDRIYHGVQIEGVDVGGMTRDEAIAALKDKENGLKEKVNIRVTGVGFDYTYTSSFIPCKFDTADIVELAYGVGRNIEDREKAFSYVQALPQQPVKLDIHGEMLWDDGMEAIYDHIVKSAQWKPRSNQITSFNLGEDGSYYLETSAGLNGITIDEDRLYNMLYTMFNNRQYVGSLSLFEIEREVPFTPVDYSGVQLMPLSTFSTTSTNNANGNHNMALALSLCNGFVIQPGESFQFNQRVGNSTTAAGGWRQAGAIENGVSSTAYGGGICQASTTIYGAALRAGLTITKRANHSIPSTYVPLGQDAAISYGSSVQDLWIRNDYTTPVFLSCGMNGAVLTASFLCIEHPTDWDTIEVNSWSTSTIPAKTGVEYVPNDGKHRSGAVAASARKGYTASGVRIYYKNGAEVKREAIADSLYPATAKKVFR